MRDRRTADGMDRDGDIHSTIRNPERHPTVTSVLRLRQFQMYRRHVSPPRLKASRIQALSRLLQEVSDTQSRGQLDRDSALNERVPIGDSPNT